MSAPFRTRPDAAAPLPAHGSLAAIRWELDGLMRNSAELEPITPPASLERARALWLRQALERAVEHGAAMLDALGLPRLVDADFAPLDPLAIGDALDAAVAALDAADGDPDHEAGGDDEPSLGWITSAAGVAFPGSTDDGELDTADDEPSLASPERHPRVPTVTWGRAYTARGGDEGQLRWAEGAQHDGEAVNEDGDDLDRGEHDTADMEPSIGWPNDPGAVLADALQADHDPEGDDADAEPEEGVAALWVYGPSRREVAHA